LVHSDHKRTLHKEIASETEDDEDHEDHIDRHAKKSTSLASGYDSLKSCTFTTIEMPPTLHDNSAIGL
jgi:hypothetical protein